MISFKEGEGHSKTTQPLQITRDLHVAANAQSRMLIGKFPDISLEHEFSSKRLDFLEANIFPEKNKKGEFTIQQKKKKREIIQEGKNQVEVPPEVGDEDKKALEQTGDDATSGW